MSLAPDPVPRPSRPEGVDGSRSIADVIRTAGVALREQGRVGATATGTGFSPLDAQLGGGLRAGDFVVVAGAQGLGKTALTLQMARNIAAGGGHAIYSCFEHDEEALLERLLVMEAGIAAGFDAPTMAQLRRRLSSGSVGGRDLDEALSDLPGGSHAVRCLSSYGDRLRLQRARGDRTTVDHLAQAVRNTGRSAVLFVDYLQKVADDDRHDEEARVARTAGRLKDLALELQVPIVGVAALERLAPDVRRARARHLKGSVTLAYEADVILMLNAKHEIVARDHLMYGVGNAERYREQVVVSIEKNRAGRSDIDLEFTKRLEQGRFEPEGAFVTERLIDERIHVE